MTGQTLESIIENFTENEIKDLCFVINHFGDRRPGGGVYADAYSVKFYRRKHAESCIDSALESDNLSSEGKFFIQQLKNKMESL